MVILGIVYWVYHNNQDISRPSKCPLLSVGHLDMPSISTPGRRDKTLPAAAIPAPGKLRSRTAWKKVGCLGKIGEPLSHFGETLGIGLDFNKANFGGGNQKMDMEESHQFVFGITNKSNK
jgi:hypothetical protein